MNEDESTAEVRHLGNLYPRSNDDQLQYWHIKFLKFDALKVRRAVIRFYDSDHVGFIDKTGLLDMINEESGNGAPTPQDRAATAAQEAATRLDYDRREQKKASASFIPVNSILHGLTNQELDELKAAALATIPESTRAFLCKSDPKTSPSLRWHMAEIYRKATSREAS